VDVKKIFCRATYIFCKALLEMVEVAFRYLIGIWLLSGLSGPGSSDMFLIGTFFKWSRSSDIFLLGKFLKWSKWSWIK
jgi:hypothetical protein